MNHSTTATATVTDPVCGMPIDPAKAVGSSSYNGQTYHFCSRGCETKFDAAPTQYAGTILAAAESASCCSTAKTASCCSPATSCC